MTMNEVPPPRRTGIGRRRILGAAGALAGGLVVSSFAGTAEAAPRSARTRLTLPSPTGRYRVGTVSLHLVDHDRQDPYWSTAHPRELMVSVWYPALDLGPYRLAPWMPPAALEYFRAEWAVPLGALLDDVDFPVTHARQDVPVDPSVRRCPV